MCRCRLLFHVVNLAFRAPSERRGTFHAMCQSGLFRGLSTMLEGWPVGPHKVTVTRPWRLPRLGTKTKSSRARRHCNDVTSPSTFVILELPLTYHCYCNCISCCGQEISPWRWRNSTADGLQSPLFPLPSAPRSLAVLLRVRHNSTPLAVVCSAGPRPVSKNRLTKFQNISAENGSGGHLGEVKVLGNGPRFCLLGSLF